MKVGSSWIAASSNMNVCMSFHHTFCAISVCCCILLYDNRPVPHTGACSIIGNGLVSFGTRQFCVIGTEVTAPSKDTMVFVPRTEKNEREREGNLLCFRDDYRHRNVLVPPGAVPKAFPLLSQRELSLETLRGLSTFFSAQCGAFAVERDVKTNELAQHEAKLKTIPSRSWWRRPAWFPNCFGEGTHHGNDLIAGSFAAVFHNCNPLIEVGKLALAQWRTSVASIEHYTPAYRHEEMMFQPAPLLYPMVAHKKGTIPSRKYRTTASHTMLSI